MSRDEMILAGGIAAVVMLGVTFASIRRFVKDARETKRIAKIREAQLEASDAILRRAIELNEPSILAAAGAIEQGLNATEMMSAVLSVAVMVFLATLTAAAGFMMLVMPADVRMFGIGMVTVSFVITAAALVGIARQLQAFDYYQKRRTRFQIFALKEVTQIEEVARLLMKIEDRPDDDEEPGEAESGTPVA
jgi:hypothetical protein